MSLTLEPELYSPSIDEQGNYVDKIPPASAFSHGLKCPCGSRRDKSYISHGVFSQHIKTKIHQKWLQDVNLNRINYYVENQSLKDVVNNQRLIISRMEKELSNKSTTIDYLTRQLINTTAAAAASNTTSHNLLEFD